jgi:hypothetical protein
LLARDGRTEKRGLHVLDMMVGRQLGGYRIIYGLIVSYMPAQNKFSK